jgi:NADPH:quinone reductase-like Zn-dependent oxidoreductase
VKALLSRAPGGPETLELGERPDPVAGPGEIVVRVRACSINYPDVLIIEDKYQMRPTRPFAPGGEVAGEIEQVGEGVSGWAVGDRVIAVTGFGGLAEKLKVQPHMLHRLPDSVGFVDGAALLMTYATAIHALVDRADLKEGELLYVLGAAGGVGLAAVEIGRALGANVVACTSSDEKAAAAVAAGATGSIVYPRGPLDAEASKALARTFKEVAGPRGVQVVLDAVGGDYAEPAIRAMGWEGRFLVIGFPAGIPKIPLNLVLLKSCDIRGVFWGAFFARDPQADARNVARLFQWWDEGKIAPRVSATYPLERAGEAIAALRDRQVIGKLVVTLD